MNKILLVDDDRELTSLLKELLEMEGFNVLVAHDGEQALELLDDSIDLLLLDVMMPKKNGIDTLKALRQTHQTPVIMLTARGSELDRVLGLSLRSAPITRPSEVTSNNRCPGGAHLSIARNRRRHHIRSLGGSFASSASTCCSIINPWRCSLSSSSVIWRESSLGNISTSISTSASVNQKMAKMRAVKLPIMKRKPSDSRDHAMF